MAHFAGTQQRPIYQLSSLTGFCTGSNAAVRLGQTAVRQGFPAISQGHRAPLPAPAPTVCSALRALSPVSPSDSAPSARASGLLAYDPASPHVAVEHRGAELGWPTDLDAHYSLGGFLGAGSYGVCYQATHMASNRTYAVKMLAKERPKASRAHTIRRLSREAALLERLSGCGNVVQLVDKFESDDAVYFVLELCTGVDLQEVLRERGCLDEQTTARIVYECLRVLKACHAAGVVHNDVKPGNFMVDVATLVGPCAGGWSGECNSDTALLKLLDFGCSQPLNPNGSPLSKRTGTPIYMAPEVYLKQYDESADLWSLGMMFHQCLTGRFPFWASVQDCLNHSISQVMQSILGDEIRLEGGQLDGASPHCRDLLARLLVRDPSQRISVDDALAHPWFQQFQSGCEDCSSQRSFGAGAGAPAAAAGKENNILPFPRDAPAAPGHAPLAISSLANDDSLGAEAACETTPLSVWAAMQGTPWFPMV